MKKMKTLITKNQLLFSIVILCVFTWLLHYFYVPVLSDFLFKYFNIFSVSVLVLIYSRLIGITNKEDFSINEEKEVKVRSTVILILVIELIISILFKYYKQSHLPEFSYTICLSPMLGFLLSRPLVRLNNLDVCEIIKVKS